MSGPAAENARSKRLLLAGMDDYIQGWVNRAHPDSEVDRKLVENMVMNRNRIARFFEMETRKLETFKTFESLGSAISARD